MPEYMGRMAGYLRGPAGHAELGGLALCLSGGDLPKQNAPEVNIRVNESGKGARKGPTQQQPSWRTDVRGIPRAIYSYARTG